ncbi:hypothetical protein QTH91_14525 [Variovorax dokdonensis]|uniref:Uncharacterized protein n=1 Tax=Variovorax dokdonensis TaxID=344883 RepID=A0ABT7NCP0_9BURK|nr:hypothetical protein [Variovorax dokdonensis]MDM0045702.1 hypothetical protein [Variovorax dokdonensis]
MSKPPEPELSSLQTAQKRVQGIFSSVAQAVTSLGQTVVDRLEEVDRTRGITAVVADTGQRIGEVIAAADQQLGVSDKVATTGKAAAELFSETSTRVQKAAQSSGISGGLQNNFLDPVQKAVSIITESPLVKEGLDSVEQAYGKTRNLVMDVVMPSLPTYDAKELLTSTRTELNYVAACILQISPEASSDLGRKFGRVVTAKISGATSAAALLGLVVTFGNAGTGAAIAGLSGAAATNATLAWVGSLVGGGMAAGALLTGGLAVIVGYGTVRLLASERRELETLSEIDLRLVQSCWMLGTLADAYRRHPEHFGATEAQQLQEALRSLARELDENLELLCAPLDATRQVALRHHAIPDLQRTVIERWDIYLNWASSPDGRAWHAERAAAAATLPKGLSPAGDPACPEADTREDKHLLMQGHAHSVIGGVFAALLTGEPLDDSMQSRLVLQAIRRSTISLANASAAEIGDYLRSLSPEQLRGVASNVKGIYHELWYVEQYNNLHEDSFARVFGVTNHAGADVQICDSDTGQVIREVQLKAVATSAEVREHLQRYPHINVASTDEVAASMHNSAVHSTGVSNEELHARTTTSLDALHNHTIFHRASDVGLASLGVASMAELLQMLRGERKFPEAVTKSISTAATAVGATALTAFLFS